jgi:hypothetical protein
MCVRLSPHGERVTERPSTPALTTQEVFLRGDGGEGCRQRHSWNAL